MRPRLRRLVSRWRKPGGLTAAPTVTDEIAVRNDAAQQQPAEDGPSRSASDTERRLAHAQTRLKRAMPPKKE